MTYLLDSNVFIQAKNTYYGMDFCPAFWAWIDHANGHHGVASIDWVYKELVEGGDELAKWVKARKGPTLFLPVSDSQTQEKYVEVVNYVQGNKNYTDPAKVKFLAKADPWLIAKAAIMGATVVTHEKPDKIAKAAVKIPDVCDQFGVGYLNTFDLLRSLKAKFGHMPGTK